MGYPTMVDRNILAIHDRIDEEASELHLLKGAVRALQERVILLEAQVRELRRDARDLEDSDPVRRNRTA